MKEGDDPESRHREESEKRSIHSFWEADAFNLVPEDRPQGELDGGDDDARDDPCGDHGKREWYSFSLILAILALYREQRTDYPRRYSGNHGVIRDIFENDGSRSNDGAFADFYSCENRGINTHEAAGTDGNGSMHGRKHFLQRMVFIAHVDMRENHDALGDRHMIAALNFVCKVEETFITDEAMMPECKT